MSFVSIDKACFSYQQTQLIVDAVDWQIERGDIHCLVGRSGCGKTTLLKLAAGLLLPDSGSVCINGNRVARPDQTIGFVFQSPNLLEWLSVLENVLLPISLQRKPNSADIGKAQQQLVLVGLSNFHARYPHELSGGQQSRVAIARALITEPLVLLMDEPFAALDALTREELQDDLLKLCENQKTTVLFVTHDIAEAIYLADRIAVMDSGQVRHQFDINLPRPRQHEIRFGVEFNALCQDARTAMLGHSSVNAPATLADPISETAKQESMSA